MIKWVYNLLQPLGDKTVVLSAVTLNNRVCAARHGKMDHIGFNISAFPMNNIGLVQNLHP